MKEFNPTKRFSKRALYYSKGRPGYPEEIVFLLKSECSLTPFCVIADIGSGTGLLSELFLKNGNTVFGVEPNEDMRRIAEKRLGGYPNFISLEGTAEAIPLKDRSVDFITVGHAFHWFSVDKSRTEFLRILRPDGWVVIVWNQRRTDSTPFLRAYEGLLLRFGTDYAKVNPLNFNDSVLYSFFGRYGFKLRVFKNLQALDFEGLKNRLLSSSYVPMEGSLGYDNMMRELEAIFYQHSENGKVIFEYDTKVYYGKLT
ncbi:MAG: methyltransferase [Deltaproteobacteria bacterium]|jgi:ubiquinone/menaquinone biosynthesis C-methylase UbiE|nr:MAG: methyltransferase [Deltaproteobacteria bacterium]